MFIFDEATDTLITRASGLGIDLKKFVDSGDILIQAVDPAGACPATALVRSAGALDHR
jgi:hypothetical protein